RDDALADRGTHQFLGARGRGCGRRRADRRRRHPRTPVERGVVGAKPYLAQGAPLSMMLPRMRFTLALFFTILVVFTGRLMFLQLARSDEFVARSMLNATEQQRIVPLRGRILARDGTVLAD